MTARPELTLLLLMTAAGAQAELYRWTDSHGNTQYSDKAPANAKASSIPTPEPVRTGTGSLKPRSAAHDDDAPAPARDDTANADKQRACASAREDLQYWLDRRPYTVNQQTDNPEFTNDAWYNQRVTDAQQRVRKRCKP